MSKNFNLFANLFPRAMVAPRGERHATYYGHAFLMIFPYIIEAEEVTPDETFGAASAYILVGLTWALLFQVIESLYPGSFHVIAERNIDGILTWSDFLFFSFTTLTTLGFGDITPITSQGRSLAILEALTEVIFIAIILGRSTGLYVTQQLSQNINATRDLETKSPPPKK